MQEAKLKQLAIAFDLFPTTIKVKIRELHEHADAKRTERGTPSAT